MVVTRARKVCKNAHDDVNHRKRPANYPGPRCTTCHRQGRRTTRQYNHSKYVQDTYGLLPGDYDTLYAYQGGVCYGCRRATGKVRRLAVDHDHALGFTREAVRGLLCKTCNKTLGHFRDDPEAFERLAEYLRNPPSRSALTWQ